jgi:predicted nuclease of predicted toxin-antitoxin system
MNFLIDMNLSPQWVAVFENAGWEARHWSFTGKQNAPDQEIFEYAKSNGYVIFTHDLDFGTILAAKRTSHAEPFRSISRVFCPPIRCFLKSDKQVNPHLLYHVL